MNGEPEQETRSSENRTRRESGLPGGGQGRVEHTGLSGVYSGTGPWPEGAVEIRTPAEFVRGQTDEKGRQVEGGSQLIYFQGQTLIGGVTPPSSSPPKTGRKAGRK